MTHYDTLGVSPAAGPEEVRRAWLSRAREHHPDRGGDPARMRAVNEAWSVLGDPDARRRYDRSLGDPPHEAVDLDADEVDDDDLTDVAAFVPIRATRSRPLLALVPPSLFLLSVFVGSVALVLDEPAVLGVAVVLFMLSCVSVLAVALLSLRGPRPGRR
jgi:hypothetical protein